METVPIQVLVGPTAAGKTDVIHHLARERQALILSADSMLVYRGMDIGTAKPTPAERAGLTYRGIDLVEPGEPFSVVDFLKEARRALADCIRDNRPLLIAGGTGLYVRCLLEGLRTEPGADRVGRAAREKMVDAGRIEDLQEELRRRTPEVWATLPVADRSNPRRLIRILEKVDAGMGQICRSWAVDPHLQPEVAGLNMPRAVLHEAIHERIRRMYEGGLLEEVRALLAAGLASDSTAWQAIGYAEAAACLRGELTRESAMERTLFRTRQLAKRQMTWFRGQLRVRWVDRESGESPAVTAARVAAVWAEIGSVRLKGLDA
jgi:tRNA dimethylallyltransferase